MTPKEKAEELVNKFRDFADGINPETDSFSPNICKIQAKQCALIAVNEILNEFPKGFNGNFEMRRKLYWEEVKQEIYKL